MDYKKIGESYFIFIYVLKNILINVFQFELSKDEYIIDFFKNLEQALNDNSKNTILWDKLKTHLNNYSVYFNHINKLNNNKFNNTIVDFEQFKNEIKYKKPFKEIINNPGYINFKTMLLLIHKSWNNFIRHNLIKNQNNLPDLKFDENEKNFLNKFYKIGHISNIKDIEIINKYLYFLSFFISKEIINKFINSYITKKFKPKSLKSEIIKNPNQYLLDKQQEYDENKQYCKWLKNKIINEYETIDIDNQSYKKEERKNKEKNLHNLIFRVFIFHINKWNKDINHKYKLKTKYSYDISKQNIGYTFNEKRTYSNLAPNKIFIYNKYLLPINIDIKNICEYYNKKNDMDIFKYENFNELFSEIINKCVEYETKIRDSKKNNENNKELITEIYKKYNKELSINIKKIIKNNQNWETITEKNKVFSKDEFIASLNGIRKKINNDFLWFLKLSSSFFDKEEIKKNFKFKSSNPDWKLFLKSIDYYSYNILSKKRDKNSNTIDDILKKINNENIINSWEKIKQIDMQQNIDDNWLNLKQEINNLKSQLWHYYEQNKLMNNNVDQNDNNAKFIIDKKTFKKILKKVNKKESLNLKEKLNLYLKYNINGYIVQDFIKKDFKEILKKFIDNKSEDDFFEDIYEYLYSVKDKQNYCSSQELEQKRDNIKPWEIFKNKFSFLKKINEINNDNIPLYDQYLDWNIKSIIINEFNNIDNFFESYGKCIDTLRDDNSDEFKKIRHPFSSKASFKDIVKIIKKQNNFN